MFTGVFHTFGSRNTEDMTELHQLLIDNLKYYRKAKKLKQSDIAESCGILASTYSRLETGQVVPNFGTIEKLADAIGVEVVTLLQSREISDKSLVQKLEMINGMSDYNRNVAEVMIDTVIEKDKLEQDQQVKMKRRLAELERVKNKN